MPIFLFFLFIALLIHDAAFLFLGNLYMVREVSQGIILAGGVYWLLVHTRHVVWQKYGLLFLFFITLVIGIPGAQSPVFVGLQVTSLAAVCLFFIAYHESVPSYSKYNDALSNFFLLAGGIIFTISLLGIKIWPDTVYETRPFLQEMGRFRGLFVEPAVMGGMAGLVLGLAIFGRVSLLLKVPIGIMSAACLFLQLSRGYWIAWLAATLFAWWWGARHKRIRSAAMLAFVLLFIGAISVSFDLVPSDNTLNTVFRTETMGTLTGRTTLWQDGFESFQERPWLGYGFTMGGVALKRPPSELNAEYRGPGSSTRTVTLHNGYIQMLLDSGLIGALLYITLLFKAIYNIIRTRNEVLVIPLFVLVFVAVANLAATVLHSAATFLSVLGWYYIVFGLNLGNNTHTVKGRKLRGRVNRNLVRKRLIPNKRLDK